MAEVYYIDLLALLKFVRGRTRDGMKDCTLYGRLVKQIDYPSVIKPGVVLDDDGMFAVMEVFAVNVGQYSTILRERGIQNKDNVFMVNGNAIVYVSKSAVAGVDWYQVTGTIRSPSVKESSNCVAMLNFYKTGNNWGLRPCPVADFDIASWDRHAPPYAWIKTSGDADAIKHPPEVLNLPRFEHFDSTSTHVPKPKVPSDQAYDDDVPHINTVVRSFNKENRQVVKPVGKQYDVWSGELDTAEKSKEAFIKTILKDYKKGTCSDKYLRYMVRGILANFTKRRTPYALTGRAVVKKYLDTNSLSGKPYLGRRSAGEYIADNFQEIARYITDDGVRVNADGDALDLCRTMFGDKERFYAGVVGVTVGIPSDTIEEMVMFCDGRGLSITKILNENPYMIQFFSSINFDEIERIAMCFGRHEDSMLSAYRNTAMLNAHISDPSDGSTLFKKSQLLRDNIGVRLTKLKFEKVRRGETYLTDAMATNIDSFIRDTRSPSLTYHPAGFRLCAGGYYVRCMSEGEIEKAVKDYVKTGLGVVQGDYITSSDLLKKELFVFNQLYKLAKVTHKYKTEDIDACISEYEALAGFKLEESQVRAVHLLTNSAFVVAGSAGSGKTTVSKCVVYTLRKLTPALEIKFAAPTGKAAKRMQEVVQEECRTLHSTFHIGQSADNVFTTEDADAVGSNTAFFFDESAMITIDLLYKVLRNIDMESARVFLFGDFNQLSPIGKGLPFKNLLRFMPCVFLDVVKRAAEGSNITANSCIVNENSDNGKWQWLRNGKDFFLLDCGGDRIQNLVYSLCAHYLGVAKDDGTLARMLSLDYLPECPGLTPDDIQVVSPLTKRSYPWGATVLNRVLQPLFNPTKAYDKTFIYQVTKASDPAKFMIGDRVIHTEKNMYSMQWYGTYKGGKFRKVYGQGICNGEVGKIVDFIPAKSAKVQNETEPKPDDFEYTDNLRNDAYHCGKDDYFVVVEYYDFISSRNFYILYRAQLNMSVQSNEGIVFRGDDIQKLNLFYAGTTHKLQGSQAKLIIFALDDIRFDGFITRQMVYTMMTRAEKLCFGVGSVGNNNSSMLTRARLDIASADTLTVGEILV